jgi:ADP-heptose:LPS heptosyltransferase
MIDNKYIYINNRLFISGGLGDCLLYTPLIRHLYMNSNRKVLVYVFSEDQKAIFQNNPYCSVRLLRNGNIKNKIQKHFQPYFYGLFLPSLSFKTKASRIIAKSFKTFEIENDSPEIFLTKKELRIGKDLISKNKNTIVINPNTACSKNKEWFFDRWNKVVSELQDYTFIQVGIENEQLIEGVMDFRVGYSLREQLAILANSRLYLGVDSFWAHAAAALNVKGIVLFGASTPVIWGHDNNVNIYKAMSCSPCIDWILNTECPYSKKCMTSITVDEVVVNIKLNFNV